MASKRALASKEYILVVLHSVLYDLHLDEATPPLHIDFIPYVTGSKRDLDTRLSLKQALSLLGFKSRSRSETERNRYIQKGKISYGHEEK